MCVGVGGDSNTKFIEFRDVKELLTNAGVVTCQLCVTQGKVAKLQDGNDVTFNISNR